MDSKTLTAGDEIVKECNKVSKTKRTNEAKEKIKLKDVLSHMASKLRALMFKSLAKDRLQ